MATFTITVEDTINLPPDQIGNLSLTITDQDTYIFTSADFTTNTNPRYSDPEEDSAETLKIVSLNLGDNILKLNGIEVTEDDEITFVDIDDGDLTIEGVIETGISAVNERSFNFDIADSGSSTFSGLEGTVSVNILQQVNLPPSEVGDGEINVAEDNVITFTESMFTATTPAYSDPESNPPSKLKIVSVPSNGDIKLNGVILNNNAIVSFDLIRLGALQFFPDNVNEDTIDTFEFQIADTGSNIFVG
jgi:hypothetical protein